jgi:hypothetical protein
VGQPNRELQEAFPPDVATGEEKRRWEMCAMAAWLSYGYTDESPLDRWDLELLHQATRTFYASEHETGDGTLSDEQRTMLRSRGVL